MSFLFKVGVAPTYKAVKVTLTDATNCDNQISVTYQRNVFGNISVLYNGNCYDMANVFDGGNVKFKSKTENKTVECFLDYKAMLDSGLVDAVLVETPHYQHPEIVMEGNFSMTKTCSFP